MLRIEKNTEKNGIELYFDEKPTQNTIDHLKMNGFKWHNIKKCWFAKENEETNKAVILIDEIKEEITKGTTTKEKSKYTWTKNGFYYTEDNKREYFKGSYDYNPTKFEIKFYSHNYKDLPVPKGAIKTNNTDIMTDYFEEDKLLLNPLAEEFWPAFEAYAKYVNKPELIAEIRKDLETLDLTKFDEIVAQRIREKEERDRLERLEQNISFAERNLKDYNGGKNNYFDCVFKVENDITSVSITNYKDLSFGKSLSSRDVFELYAIKTNIKTGETVRSQYELTRDEYIQFKNEFNEKSLEIVAKAHTNKMNG